MVSDDSTGLFLKYNAHTSLDILSHRPTVNTKSLREGSTQGTDTILTVHINNQDTLTKVLCSLISTVSSKVHLTTLILHTLTTYSLSSG